MPPKGKYTDPKLRDKVKEEVQQGDKGGAPGQWSARKAQFMASEYKKRGGEYTTDKETGQDESQKSLSKWGDEDWQTKEGSGNAKQEDGSEKRYLPKKAWEKMTEEEKEETDAKKQKESKGGKQHVANTGKAKQARANANKEENENDDAEKSKKEDKSKTDTEADGNGPRRGRSAGKQSNKDASKDDSADNKKRDRSEKAAESNKKQKSDGGDKKSTIGSKHDSADEPAPRASVDRLPKKGQRVSWKALPGWVHGEVLEIARENKTIEGKTVKASEKDPRIVMKSDNGKVAVHKPEAVHFE